MCYLREVQYHTTLIGGSDMTQDLRHQLIRSHALVDIIKMLSNSGVVAVTSSESCGICHELSSNRENMTRSQEGSQLGTRMTAAVSRVLPKRIRSPLQPKLHLMQRNEQCHAPLSRCPCNSLIGKACSAHKHQRPRSVNNLATPAYLIASIRLDFPAPLGPITAVKSLKGPMDWAPA